MNSLAGIKARRNILKNNDYALSFTDKDIEWLIEQAERVEELEKVEYALQETYRQEREYSKKLEQQNKYYREIIQDFIDYADDYNIAKVEKYHLRKALESEEWVKNGWKNWRNLNERRLYWQT